MSCLIVAAVVSENLQPTLSLSSAGSYSSPPSYEVYSEIDLLAVQRCVNQTSCTQPLLQLQRSYRVYICQPVSGSYSNSKLFDLITEGILAHPKLSFSPVSQADVLIHIPSPLLYDEVDCLQEAQNFGKVMVLDDSDSHMLHPFLQYIYNKTHETSKSQLNNASSPFITRQTSVHDHPHQQSLSVLRDFMLYFKRSYYIRKDGRFQSYAPYVHSSWPLILPFSHSLSSNTLRHKPLALRSRNIEISFISGKNSTYDDFTINRVQTWTGEYVRERGIKTGHWRGQSMGNSKSSLAESEQTLQSSKIAVICSPSYTETTSDLMLALSSGALVFADNSYTPRAHIPRHEQHLIYYNNHNKTEFFALLDRFRADASPMSKSSSSEIHLSVAERIALTGYLHSIRLLRSVNLLDYLFRTVHIMQLERQAGNSERDSHHMHQAHEHSLHDNHAYHTRLQHQMKHLASDHAYASSALYGYSKDHGFGLRMQALRPQYFVNEGVEEIVAPGSAQAVMQPA